MVKCPKCQRNIDSLIAVETKTSEAIAELGGLNGNKLMYSNENVNIIEIDYACPECQELLRIGDEEQAIAFLKGELELVP